MQNLKTQLEQIWCIEEIKAKQRSRDRFIKEGDCNTTYFQALANNKKRKKMITSFQGPEGEVTDQKEMLNIATDFYKTLF